MSLDIKGINNLIKKLDNLSNIDTKSVVHRVAEDMTLSIQDEVKKFSDKYEYVGQCHVRCYRKGIYIDVGLSNDLDPWDDWKELWYHQWGYRDYGLNFSGSPFIDVHKMWFDSYYADNTRQGAEYSILVNLYVSAENLESTKDKLIKLLNKAGLKGGRVQEPRKEKDLYNIPIGFKAFKR